MNMTAFLKENAKYVALNKSVLFHLRSHIKNSCFTFHQGCQTPRNNKSTRPRAFICFSVFGTPDETLALVFDILHQDQSNVQINAGTVPKQLS